MTKRFIYILFVVSFLFSCSPKQQLQESSTSQTTLLNGPMVGYSTMKEVPVWVQTAQSGVVQLNYYSTDEPSTIFQSNQKTTQQSDGYTAKLYADQLLPGKKYEYNVLLDGKVVGSGRFQSQSLWQWRTDPPAFSFAAGSCTYINEKALDRPGDPYGGDYRIFESIYSKSPDFMLWGGDNMYLREADWHSMTGIWHRYTHTRSTSEMSELLANTHNYAIWDDHDFGPNNSDRSFYLKDSTLKVFNHFWANPTQGIHGMPGITTKFQWADCEFFLLDNRYYRTPNARKESNRTILGEKQLEWLFDELINSKGSFKFVVLGGQLLNTAAEYENYATYPEEREKIIRYIQEHNIENVVFISGDRHHSEVSVLKEDGLPTIHDVTVSPLTSSSHRAGDEVNANRVDGSYIGQRNFGLFTVTGEWGNRTISLSYFDSDGNSIYDYQIKQQ